MTARAAGVRSFEVARLAGVSRSAVSRAFTDGASIAPETKRRIVEAANALGYSPSAIARTLNTGRSRIVGLVIAELANPFYADLLDRLSRALQATGVSPLLFVCQTAGEIDDLVPRLLSYNVDGVIVAAATMSSTMAARCQAHGVPVVLINRYVSLEGVSAVCCDNAAGGELAAEHLIAAGCRRLSFMAGAADTSSSMDRERGFRSGVARAGLPAPSVARGDYSYQGALVAARALLDGPSRPDGLFCANDVMAMAALDVARFDFGLKPPDDLLVMGFDNCAQAAWPAYDLTSVDQDTAGMIATAVALASAQIESGARAAQRTTLTPRIVERSSTRRLARRD